MPGLYIHVPFCLRKCRYCDFYSVPAEADLVNAFLDALAAELAGLPEGFAPDTVYVGGGTPTVLEPAALARLCGLVHGRAGTGVVEWSCEANPGTLTEEKARLLLDAGVNRVSLGVQSFDDSALRFLGRAHTAEQAERAFRLLRECGVRNAGVDLMHGIPGTSRAALGRDLDRVAALAPEHVACYALIFEEGTPLAAQRDAGRVSEMPDREQLAQYRQVRRRLGAAGYRHYEISNFAKPGFECRHNLLYWGAGEYIGVGPAAHSHWGGARYGNVRDVGAYCDAMLSGRPARAFEERLDPEAKARETLVMSLRQLDGVSREEFAKRTGFDYRALRGREIDLLRETGMVEEAGGRLRLTEKGLFVSDSVFAELV